MSLSTYYLEYGSHLARLHRRRRRRRAYAPTSSTASHDNHEQKSTHGSPFVSHMRMGLLLAALRAAGAPLIFPCRRRPGATPARAIQGVVRKEVWNTQDKHGGVRPPL